MIEITILLSNLLLTTVIVITTLYRVYIEKKQIDVIISNAKYVERIKLLRKTIKKERKTILEMGGEDVLALLEEVCKDEN